MLEESEIDDEDYQYENNEISKIQQVYRKTKITKNAARSAAFQVKKQALYEEARKTSNNIVRVGTAYLEDARASITSLKAQQVGFQKYFDDCQPLESAKQESSERLLSRYLLLETLGPRRSDEINSASRMLKNHPAQRTNVLQEFSRKARIRVEQAKQREKTATDASDLIERCKDLLRS